MLHNKDKKGVSYLEYALIAALIGAVGAVGGGFVGSETSGLFGRIANVVSGDSGGSGGSGGGTDTVPDAFSFTANPAAPTSTQVSSDAITVSGIDTATPISVTGDGTPQISINGGGFVTSGTVINGDSVVVALTTPSTFSTTSTATVDIGGVTGNFQVTTEQEKITVASFSAGTPSVFYRLGQEIANNDEFFGGSSRLLDYNSLTSGAEFISPTGGIDSSLRITSDSANYLAIGDVAANLDDGAVHIFDSGGTLLRTINTPAGPGSMDEFGRSLAIENGTFVVGASQFAAGSGRIYVGSASTGSMNITITNPLGSNTLGLGQAVDIAGGLIYATVGSFGSSAAIFVFNASNGTLVHSIETPSNSIQFGSLDVAIDSASNSGFIVAGDPEYNLVFVYDGSTRNLLYTLLPSQSETNFGQEVSIGAFGTSGGVPFGRVAVTASGAVYEFDLATGSELQRVVPQETYDTGFGADVLYTDKIYVGAPALDVNGVDNAGGVYVIQPSP